MDFVLLKRPTMSGVTACSGTTTGKRSSDTRLPLCRQLSTHSTDTRWIPFFNAFSLVVFFPSLNIWRRDSIIKIKHFKYFYYSKYRVCYIIIIIMTMMMWKRKGELQNCSNLFRECLTIVINEQLQRTSIVNNALEMSYIYVAEEEA